MRDVFESWIGQEVVVHLGLGPIKMSLRGVLLRDLNEVLLMRPEAGPEIELAKTKVLAIEEVERNTSCLRHHLLSRNHSETPISTDIPPASKNMYLRRSGVWISPFRYLSFR